jgi:hypothetical protein
MCLWKIGSFASLYTKEKIEKRGLHTWSLYFYYERKLSDNATNDKNC